MNTGGSGNVNTWIKIPITGRASPLIIQFGHVTTYVYQNWLTFPTPFTNTEYSVSFMGDNLGGLGAGAQSITDLSAMNKNRTTTSFEWYSHTGSGGNNPQTWRYIAIGY